MHSGAFPPPKAEQPARWRGQGLLRHASPERSSFATRVLVVRVFVMDVGRVLVLMLQTAVTVRV